MRLIRRKKSRVAKEKKSVKVHCRNCEYFYITWDQQRPYGCRAMGFKTKRLPSWDVYQSSGEQCQSFKVKKRIASTTKKSTKRKR